MKYIILTWIICVTIQAGDFHGQISTQKTVDDKKIETKGKVLLIDYWGMKCSPCVKGLPKLQKLYTRLSKSGHFTVVASHVASARKEDILGFIKQNKYTFPVLRYFHIKENGKNISASSLPYMFLIDHKGKIVEQRHIQDLENKILKLITKAKAEK